MRKKSECAKFLKKLFIILYTAEFGPGVTSGPCHPASLRMIIREIVLFLNCLIKKDLLFSFKINSFPVAFKTTFAL